MAPIRVTVWNEFRHEQQPGKPRDVYPEGIHTTIANALRTQGFAVNTATLAEPEHGLSEKRLAETDVLLWWGHMAHDEVDDAVVDRVLHHITQRGMGFMPLHSGHFSKPFKRLMGTSCDLKWRESGDREILWVANPHHPIAQGINDRFILDEVEMYGEHFDIPHPEDIVFISWFSGGEVFRSGCCWTKGRGRVFYFRPGHETYPIYHHRTVQQVLANGVRWCARREHEHGWGPAPKYGHFAALDLNALTA